MDNLWNAYAALEKSKVKGASAPHILTDLVSLVRFAMHRDDELVPFPERVNANFEKWMAGHVNPARAEFTPEQHPLARNDPRSYRRESGIEVDDFDLAPFAQEGGLGKVHQVFGDDLNKILDELNGVLAA